MENDKVIKFLINEDYHIYDVENFDREQNFIQNVQGRRIELKFSNTSTHSFTVKNNYISFRLSFATGILDLTFKTRKNSLFKTKILDYTNTTNLLKYSGKNNFEYSINGIVEFVEKKIFDKKAIYYLKCKYVAKDSLIIINNGELYSENF